MSKQDPNVVTFKVKLDDNFMHDLLRYAGFRNPNYITEGTIKKARAAIKKGLKGMTFSPDQMQIDPAEEELFHEFLDDAGICPPEDEE